MELQANKQAVFGPHLRLLGMAVLWGASWPAGRVIAQNMPPLAGACLRFVLAALVLLPWMYYAGGFAQLKNWSTQRWLGMVAAGATGVFGYAAFFLSGLQYLPAGKAALVITLNPVVTLALVALRLPETLSHRNPQALQPRALVGTWLHVLRNPTFWAFSLQTTATYGGLFTFLASSSFVYIDVLGLTRTMYGWVMASACVAYFGGTFVCRALLARFGRTPKADLHETLLTMGMEDGAQYLIREYALPLDRNGYLDVMREVIAQLYEKVELKPGVRDTLARLRAEGARMCVCTNTWSSQCRTVLTRLGIDEYFDFYIEARGAMSKSSPAPFMEALHRLGGTSPAGCAVCEDAIYAAQTAHDAGFYLVGIQDVSSAADAPALRRVCDQFLPDWTALDWAQV